MHVCIRAMNETAETAEAAENEMHKGKEEEEEDILRSKQKTFDNCKWKLAWALPLLLHFLVLLSTTIVHNNNPSNNRNRQLLEHGLRGNDAPINRTLDNNNHNNNSTSSIPASNLTIPLHAHSGTHHVHLYVGSPPQKQTLIVDTGSRAMAFPCTIAGMSDCCGSHASDYYFDPSQSTTHFVSNCGNCLLEGISACRQPLSFPGQSAKPNYCTFSQTYTEGSSWTATEVEDLVWLGTADNTQSLEIMPKLAVAYPFGCQTSSTGLFRNQYADGILGLSVHETSLVKAFWKEGLIERNAFGLCFTPKGGVFSLGGSLDPHNYHLDEMKTTPITHRDQHGYYSVEVIKLVVGDNIVVTDAETKPRLLKDLNAGKGCILDSGTTDSYFPVSLSRAVRKAVVAYGMNIGLTEQKIILDDDDADLFSSKLRHKEYTYDDFESFLPILTVVLANNVELKLLPKHYMENVPLDEHGNLVKWEGSLKLTNRLYFEEQKGSVLGQNAFFGYDILFDASDDAPRIGVAPSDCHSAASDLVTTGR